MAPPFPSPVATWHDDTYPAISPSSKALSAAGKTIVITGGGRGIGREIALSFAEAGAASIALIGRTIKTLDESAAAITAKYKNTTVSVHAADVVDEAAVRKAADKIGKWDVLVLNAGYLSDRATMQEASIADWWKAFEINVKAAIIALQAFAPNKKENAALIGFSTAAVIFPPKNLEKGSAYAISKLATIKTFEFIAVEQPDLRVFVFHPGVIETDMYAKAEIAGLPLDKIQLPAHFTVWLASPESEFVRGKFLWCNWDVDELKKKAKEIQETDIHTTGIIGYPYSH